MTNYQNRAKKDMTFVRKSKAESKENQWWQVFRKLLSQKPKCENGI